MARASAKSPPRCVVENKVLQSSQLSCVHESDLQKTVYPARLNSMDMLPSSSLTGLGKVPSATDLFMRGRLAKLELSDAKLVEELKTALVPKRSEAERACPESLNSFFFSICRGLSCSI
ncbi:unnamed protein product [Arabidopsis arenosa]|uniref:Uncharacterized protein n=1 Tax=Arabidopsis arenosa TaxID=38785 RepID=A0A8S2B184_ARAAE|nr:unnamed protein product [Arabidopsis arenosa]